MLISRRSGQWGQEPLTQGLSDQCYLEDRGSLMQDQSDQCYLEDRGALMQGRSGQCYLGAPGS